MSESACNIKLPSIGYPPVQLSALDQQNMERLRVLREEAPFGRLKNGTPRSEIAYRVLVSNQKKSLLTPDLRWPFWTGVGLGGIAVLSLFLRRS